MDSLQSKQLITKTAELFKRYGIKSLTMDDVAKELGMSKKTIYRYVMNKAELVKTVVQDYLQEERVQVDELILSSNNSVDEMIKIADYFINQMRDFNPHSLHDMKKYYPDSWNIYNHYQFDFVVKRIKDNLVNGKKQGLYRQEIDEDVVSKIYIGGVEVLFDLQYFPSGDKPFVVLYKEYLSYYMHGIVSAKGLQLLKEQNLFKK